MKLSERTLTVLKNFAAINSGVVFRPGQKQKSMSVDKNILVEAVLEDDFPNTFGIYDINLFLGNITTLSNPELTFADEKVTMIDGDISLTYYSCEPSLVVTPPVDKELNLSNVDISFQLSNTTLTKLLKIASMNDLPNLSIIGKDGELRLQTVDLNNDTSNFASFKIGAYAGDDFTATFKTENLKLIPDDYQVDLQIGGFARFTNQAGNLKYFVAFEAEA